MSDTQAIEFQSFPLWQGTQSAPGVRSAPPFRAVWDRRGYIRQDSPPDVIDHVVAAYADDAYAHITAPPGESAWADRLAEPQIAYVLKHAARGGAFLDIGAGSTHMARQLRSRLGLERYVIVDPSLVSGDDVAELHRDYFPTPALEGRRFQTIFTANTLEHTPDPAGFLDGVRRHLVTGGRALVCVPDVTAQIAANDLTALVHEHMSYFTPQSLRTLCGARGLAVVQTFTEEDVAWAVLEVCEKATVVEVDIDPAFQRFAERLPHSLSAKAAELRALLAKGLTVGFHGASCGLNAFLYLTSLGDEPGVALFDGDDSKHGRFLPASPRPIAPAGGDAYRNVDVLYVAAMSFYDPIRRFALGQGLDPWRIRPLFEAESGA